MIVQENLVFPQAMPSTFTSESELFLSSRRQKPSRSGLSVDGWERGLEVQLLQLRTGTAARRS